MRRYIKSFMQNVYEKVIEDDYLEPLEEHDVYSILYGTRHRLSSLECPEFHKQSEDEAQKNILQKISTFGNVTPLRQFRLLGSEPSFEIVDSRIKLLKEDLSKVQDFMLGMFPKYARVMNKCVQEIDDMKQMYIARKNSLSLKQKVQRLQQATNKSKRITQLTIKAQNLKKLLNIIAQIPNLKKMSLIQLKSIKMKKMQSRQPLHKLYCLQGIQRYIEKVVINQFSRIVQVLQECLVNKFDSELYEQALKSFMIAQHNNITYEQLFGKLVQKELRRYQDELGCQFLLICQLCIKVMINLHKVFRWHRAHEDQYGWRISKLSDDDKNEQKEQQTFEDKVGTFEKNRKNSEDIKIQVNISNITKNIGKIIDQLLQDSIQQKLQRDAYQSLDPQTLETLYILHRMSEIVYNFSGTKLLRTISYFDKEMEDRIHQKKQKAQNHLKQALLHEQRNRWNRLPVDNNYSHHAIDKSIFKIWKHLQSPEYQKIVKLLNKQLQNNDREQSVINQQQQQQIWNLSEVSLPVAQKYQKYHDLIRLKPKRQVCICQSTLTAVNQFYTLLQSCIYFPVPRVQQDIICHIFNLLDSYIFNIFNVFVNLQLKERFCAEGQNGSMGQIDITDSTARQDLYIMHKYHKKRMNVQYKKLYRFIKEIRKSSKVYLKPSIDEKNMTIQPNNAGSGTLNVTSSFGHFGNFSKNKQTITEKDKEQGIDIDSIKSRVVGSYSIYYLIDYLAHMLKICGLSSHGISHQTSLNNENDRNGSQEQCGGSTPGLVQKILEYQQIIGQLCQLIYINALQTICNSKNTSSLIQAINWDQDLKKKPEKQCLLKQYAQTLSKDYREFYQKLKSMSKGQISKAVTTKLFGLYFKIHLSTILKTFFNKWILFGFETDTNKKKQITRASKVKLQKFVDYLYLDLQLNAPTDIEYITSVYQKFKTGFMILIESNWENAEKMGKQMLSKFQFIYPVSIGLLLLSQSCCYESEVEIEQKKAKLLSWMNKQLLFQ